MNAAIDISGVVLDTERLILRAFQPSDLQAFFAYASVPGVGECAGWPAHENIETTKKVLDLFIAEKKTFSVTLRRTGELIGSVGIEELQEDIPAALKAYTGRDIGYVLARSAWGSGYTTEAVRAVIDYCFNTARLDFLTCYHFVGNDRSRRVIEKSNFTRIGMIEPQTHTGETKKAVSYLLLNPTRFPGVSPLKFSDQP